MSKHAWLALQYSSWVLTNLKRLRLSGLSDIDAIDHFYVHIQQLFNMNRLYRLSLEKLKKVAQTELSGGSSFCLNFMHERYCLVFSAIATPATPRTPAGGRACGTPSPMGGLLFRPRLIRRCARIRAVSAAFVRKFYWKSLLLCPIGHNKYRLCLEFRRVSWRV